mmetsp:Transcript_145459/g.205970  ORF Transcript_145459/g.205970 Transcript_145459/m.205970 type:complete len:434 (-) Transcript_145459:280-1581(-)
MIHLRLGDCRGRRGALSTCVLALLGDFFIVVAGVPHGCTAQCMVVQQEERMLVCLKIRATSCILLDAALAAQLRTSDTHLGAVLADVGRIAVIIQGLTFDLLVLRKVTGMVEVPGKVEGNEAHPRVLARRLGRLQCPHHRQLLQVSIEFGLVLGRTRRGASDGARKKHQMRRVLLQMAALVHDEVRELRAAVCLQTPRLAKVVAGLLRPLLLWHVQRDEGAAEVVAGLATGIHAQVNAGVLVTASGDPGHGTLARFLRRGRILQVAAASAKVVRPVCTAPDGQAARPAANVVRLISPALVGHRQRAPDVLRLQTLLVLVRPEEVRLGGIAAVRAVHLVPSEPATTLPSLVFHLLMHVCRDLVAVTSTQFGCCLGFLQFLYAVGAGCGCGIALIKQLLHSLHSICKRLLLCSDRFRRRPSGRFALLGQRLRAFA